MMGDGQEIKIEGLPKIVELRPDLGVDDESIAFCFKRVDEITFKTSVSPEVMAIMLGAVRLVRCKDCKFSYEDLTVRFCSHGPCVDCCVRDDFFCADGERREKE